MFFMEWTRLRRIDVADGNPAFAAVDGVLFSADRQTLVCCPQAREGDYAVPMGTKVIGPYAFAASRLTNVTIPESVLSVANKAFICSKLRNVSIPGSVRAIGENAFFFSRDLAGLTICRGVAAIGAKAFSGCFSLKEVCIPDTVESVGSNAFRYCGDLAVVVARGSFLDEYCRREALKYRFAGENTVYPVWPEEVTRDSAEMRIRYLEAFLESIQARYSCGDYTSHVTILACKQPGPEEIILPEDGAASLIGRIVDGMEFNAPQEEQRKLADMVCAEILSALESVRAQIFGLTEKGEKIQWSQDTIDACMICAADRWYMLDLSYYD